MPLTPVKAFKYEKGMFILASNSPRRKELLSLLGIDFSVHAPEIDEVIRKGEKPAEYSFRMALEKVRSVAGYHSDSDFILGADTIVVVEGEVIGKPVDDEDALNMLLKLSGRSHDVITAFSVRRGKEEIVESVSTEVKFKELVVSEIKRYIETGEAEDKAGAYAVQGYGAYMVEAISGSYTNVVGLPLTELYRVLKRMGYCFP